ncbi:MAG: 2-oxo acid dehydrogenase subunit E2 [Geodermatophilales bacterium]|nr:2-oxo acid dehydrogenase subunit E2 [Geodermatophilales bacterium]
MPEVAAGGTEAVLHEWSVTEQAVFGAQDVLATVETDKAVVDVEAEQPGVVVKLLVAAGTSVEVGAPIAVLADPGEAVDDVDAVLAALGVADAAATAPDPEGAPDQPASPEVPAGLVPQTVSAAGLAPEGAVRNGSGGGSGRGNGRIFVSPLARRLAREAGLMLTGITGTGPGGRIVRRDVEAARQRPAESAPVAAVSAAPAGFTDVPHTPVRRAIARRLTESKQTIPHFTLGATLRVDELLALRGRLAEIGTKVSVTDLLLKAAARAHTAVPRMNVMWTSDATRTFSSVDVSVAVATTTGLLTPVVRGVERLPVAGIAAATRDLAGRAREGRLRQEELEGGSLTITNLGMYGTEAFSAIINPPQSAILAVGAARQEPVVVDGALAVGTVVHVTLSADHRVIDGALAAEWMVAFAEAVEEPLRLLV